jgi:hypothetical protein
MASDLWPSVVQRAGLWPAISCAGGVADALILTPRGQIFLLSVRAAISLLKSFGQRLTCMFILQKTGTTCGRHAAIPPSACIAPDF